jgi:hypothetical protein
MDEIKQRLSDASEACIKSYEAWRAKPADAAAREALQEDMHELRKVTARMEIELAVSERRTHGADPIPIPSHRAQRRAHGSEAEGIEDDNNRANRHQQQQQQSSGGGFNQGNNNQGGGQRRSFPIRRPEAGNVAEAAPSPVPASEPVSAPAQTADVEGEVVASAAPRRGRPLSLRRGGNDTTESSDA